MRTFALGTTGWATSPRWRSSATPTASPPRSCRWWEARPRSRPPGCAPWWRPGTWKRPPPPWGVPTRCGASLSPGTAGAAPSASRPPTSPCRPAWPCPAAGCTRYGRGRWGSPSSPVSPTSAPGPPWRGRGGPRGPSARVDGRPVRGHSASGLRFPAARRTAVRRRRRTRRADHRRRRRRPPAAGPGGWRIGVTRGGAFLGHGSLNGGGRSGEPCQAARPSGTLRGGMGVGGRVRFPMLPPQGGVPRERSERGEGGACPTPDSGWETHPLRPGPAARSTSPLGGGMVVGWSVPRRLPGHGYLNGADRRSGPGARPPIR